MNKTGDRRKIFRTNAASCFVLEAAQHLLGPFSRPFFGVKFLYDYGLCRGENRGISSEKVAFEEMLVRCERAIV
jgi:hypothetical protein